MSPRARSMILGSCLAALCAACAPPPPPPAAAVPAPMAIPAEYLLRPGDELVISILGEKESGRRVPVRPDGRISYDYVGDVAVSGRTIAQVRQEIEDHLKSIYVAPHVSVIGTTFAARIYVLGEVTAQRPVPFQDGMGLLAAMAEVGGVTFRGSHNQVLVVRGGFERPQVLEANYGKLVRGKMPDIRLMAGDIVFVPPTALTSLERVSTQVLPFFQAVISAKSAEDAARNLGKDNSPGSNTTNVEIKP